MQHAALEIGQSIAQFSRIADELRAEENGHITIGGPSPIFDLEVSEMLSEFVARYPGTKFIIRASNKKEEVYDGTADVVFAFERMPDDPDTICRRAGTLQNGFYAAHEYAAINGLPASEADLGDHKFIRIVGKDFPPSIVDWISEHVADEQIVTEVTNLETLFTVIKMGQGIGPLPSIFGDPMDGVVRAFPPPKVLDMPSWMAISPHAAHRPNVRKFVEFFAPRFKRLRNSRM
ncbi:MAG: hypothetical protein GKR98_14165 [Boseongicola sp.]|nr:MAG: hypothetical protein GKR98_14165 [Boseongicola sp.]